ncbi:polysaccharide deacetylase family protein [Rhodospirillaceae bacterium]|jgi:peptidoglycan/xylan/chitin deacetylase (PgdA/CDA1 family)|nr:polysaccharide deacetylase family protein [Rhodospirillaceae bacterium]MBT6306124.1 polysaccharide deacetylase family protein [Rhodospirillaceae bacterium]MDC0997832.1 polysaccharide deacetylase family protein [Alphaproteobacteria bacterium]MDC1441826.1 polysaccharide deacetylase family protein [Rhodospirillaceae bacterium]
MLKTHGRYSYSSLPNRTKYEWPNGTKLAVYVAMNIEAFSYGEGKGAAIAPPEQAMSHSIYSWRDYGNRVGFWRLMDMFDDLGIPVQHQINTAIYDECPDIPERIRSRNDEFLGHGYTNSQEQGGLSEADERLFIDQCTSTIKQYEGKAPTGWMSPWLSNSETTMDLLQEAGYGYVMDWTMDDQPIWMKTRNGRILSMPYPVEANDNRGIVWYRYTSSEFTDMLIDNFDEMLEQTQNDGHPLVCPISLHPFVVGRPYRIRQLRRALEHILKYKDRIWLTRPGDIYQHIQSLPEGTVPTT